MITEDLARPIRASGLLTYEDATQIGRLILDRVRATRQKVPLDLSACSDTTTPALAQLVLLRRDLLRSGSDLLITGLHGRARSVYEVNRLQTVLPSTPAPIDDVDGSPASTGVLAMA